MPRVPVSVLIPCKNEEANIRYAIEGVIDWADEVIVLDSGSTDSTQNIVRQYPVRLIEHPWEGYAKQWNWALRNIDFKHEWLLMLAADCYPHENLPQAIASATRRNQYDGYYIRYRYVFMGKWLKHAAGYPQWCLTFFKHRLVHYEEREVHEHPIVDGKVGYLAADIWHHDRKPLREFFLRHAKYAELEAQEQFHIYTGRKKRTHTLLDLFKPGKINRAVKENIWPRIPLIIRPFMRFLWLLIFRAAWLDGMPGIYYCFHSFCYHMQVSMHLRELLREKHLNKER